MRLLTDLFVGLREISSRFFGFSDRGGGCPTLSDPTPFISSLLLPDGKTYRLDTHDDLLAIARDTAPIVVVEKAAQKGVTELMIRLQFWLAYKSFSSAYFLRSVPYMRLQVQRRVEPLIAANPKLLKALFADASEDTDRGDGEEKVKVPKKYRSRDNLRLKKLWNGWCFYMGLQSEADVRMFPLDAIFVDEVETLKPELTVALHERLYHSPLKWERWFSQPTVAGYGIDERFAESDQRFFHLCCLYCGKWFNLEENFPSVLAAVTKEGRNLWGPDMSPHLWFPDYEWVYCCPFCKRTYRTFDHVRKEWVAKRPEREVHGYHLSQLYSPTLTAKDVARLWHRSQFSVRRKERFYNSVLGFPYSGGERQPITPEKCFFGDFDCGIQDPPAPRTAGVDVGDSNYLVVLEAGADGRLRVIWVEEFQGPGKWEGIRNRVRDLKVGAIGVNAMPYKDSAKKLIRQLGSEVRGLLIYDTAGRTAAFGEEDKEFGQGIPYLTVNRTELMDGTVDEVLSGKIVLPRKGTREAEDLVRHLMNYIVEYDEAGNRSYVRGRQDHFGRALDYARILWHLRDGLRIPQLGSLSGRFFPLVGPPTVSASHLEW